MRSYCRQYLNFYGPYQNGTKEIQFTSATPGSTTDMVAQPCLKVIGTPNYTSTVKFADYGDKFASSADFDNHMYRKMMDGTDKVKRLLRRCN